MTGRDCRSTRTSGAAAAASERDREARRLRSAEPIEPAHDAGDWTIEEIDVERYELNAPPRYRFEAVAPDGLDRRDFLRICTAAGGGLLVLAMAPRAAAQESGRGGRRAAPREIAAWIHIDERGAVTVYTGKTEIGQNIRTSLAQAVADELRVPLASVTMVMADTDRVPYDAGTFGSQSTPRMAPQLARAAAAARELLIDRAAAAWSVDRASLSASDAHVHGPGNRKAAYGELTKGQKLAGVIAADASIAAPSEWAIRGTPAKKVNGRDFVTGRHQFTPDLERPDMLHGRVIRPDGYAGTLVSADVGAASAMRGVTVVRDGEFLGVVAPTERAAARAAAAIAAEWRLPSDHPSSQTIFEHLKRTGRDDGRADIAGDVSAARAAAARTFDAVYRIPYIAHVPLEPRAAVAEWDAGGRLTVWCGTQRPFGVRSQLAEAFRLPEEQVRVIVPDTGSAYGGKHTGEHAIEAARLAKAAGRPVKLVWTRAEEFSFGTRGRLA